MYAPNTWRHMGWGEPAALNGVVSYVYAGHGAGTDPSDVFYIRSTDSGVTFAAAVKLNTDTTTRAQWQPNISVDPNGSLFSVWYDERETTANCVVGNPTVPCYRMYARQSTDNGATWLPTPHSRRNHPLPGQPDGTVQPNYQGDYDYGSATLGQHVTSWVDGRVTISGQSQQDTFFDKDPPGVVEASRAETWFLSRRAASLLADGDKLQAKLTLTDTSHSGEQVPITVDGSPNFVTINGNNAQLSINNPPPGQHTVELTDPAGCFAPVTRLQLMQPIVQSTHDLQLETHNQRGIRRTRRMPFLLLVEQGSEVRIGQSGNMIAQIQAHPPSVATK